MDELTTAAKLQDPFESAIMATPLSLSTLSDLPSNVRVPSYARADLTPVSSTSALAIFTAPIRRGICTG
mgnify:CR=1 FL=1